MQNKIKISSIKNNFLALIAFTLPLSKNLMPALIIITLLLWLSEGGLREKFTHLKKNHFLFAISFYLLHCAGMLYTQNIKAGSFDLEQKLSMLIFPVLIFSSDSMPYHSIEKIAKSFLLGTFCAGLICLVNACLKYYYAADADSFFYAQFSAIMHASYFSMYCCFAIALLLFRSNLIQNVSLKLSLIVFFMLLIVLIASKSGLFCLILLMLAKFIHTLIIKKTYLKASISFIFFMLSGSILYSVYPKSFERISQMNATLNNVNQDFNTTSSRVSIWKHAFHIIAEQYIVGVGTGDVKDALKEQYNTRSESQFIEKQLNAHNQYLQTFIALGLPGIIILLMLLSVLLSFTLRARLIDGFMFTVIIALNMLVESMLETQSGIIFIAFFMTLYFKEAQTQLNTKSSNIVA